MENGPQPSELPETASQATDVAREPHKRSTRALTEAERWFKNFNSAYRVRVDDHYETALERRLPFRGS